MKKLVLAILASGGLCGSAFADSAFYDFQSQTGSCSDGGTMDASGDYLQYGVESAELELCYKTFSAFSPGFGALPSNEATSCKKIALTNNSFSVSTAIPAGAGGGTDVLSGTVALQPGGNTLTLALKSVVSGSSYPASSCEYQVTYAKRD